MEYILYVELPRFTDKLIVNMKEKSEEWLRDPEEECSWEPLSFSVLKESTCLLN